jgi:hypothetical protein
MNQSIELGISVHKIADAIAEVDDARRHTYGVQTIGEQTARSGLKDRWLSIHRPVIAAITQGCVPTRLIVAVRCGSNIIIHVSGHLDKMVKHVGIHTCSVRIHGW